MEGRGLITERGKRLVWKNKREEVPPLKGMEKVVQERDKAVLGGSPREKPKTDKGCRDELPKKEKKGGVILSREIAKFTESVYRRVTFLPRI